MAIIKENILATNLIKLWKEDEILCCEFSEEIHIDLETARRCVKQRIDYSNGKSHLVLISLKGVKSVTKSARDYLADEGAQLISAGALLVNSELTRIIGTLFLALSKPLVPTRLFTDETKAKEWLKTQKA